jgi:hypothetical protein
MNKKKHFAVLKTEETAFCLKQGETLRVYHSVPFLAD